MLIREEGIDEGILNANIAARFMPALFMLGSVLFWMFEILVLLFHFSLRSGREERKNMLLVKSNHHLLPLILKSGVKAGGKQEGRLCLPGILRKNMLLPEESRQHRNGISLRI